MTKWESNERNSTSDRKFGEYGKIEISKFLRTLDGVISVDDVYNKDIGRKMDIDLIVKSVDYLDSLVCKIKIDTMADSTGNIAFETEVKSGEGCMVTSKSNVILYVLANTSIIYVMSAEVLKKYVEENTDNYTNHSVWRYGKMGENAKGYLIPIDKLISDGVIYCSYNMSTSEKIKFSSTLLPSVDKNFIGQKKLLKKVNSATLDNIPRTLMLLGNKGCGKHTIVKMLSEKLHIELRDISEIVSLDTISDIQQSVTPTMYVIDCDKISEKHQNMILKFLEEPSMYSFIVLLCNSKLQMLDTVLNRCIIWEFENYSKDELKNFTNDESMLKFASTPGDIKLLKDIDYKSYSKICKNIFNKISVASVPNILTISGKISTAEEFHIFNRILVQTALELYVVGDIVYDAWKITNEYICSSRLGGNRNQLLDSYLLEMKIGSLRWS